MNCAFKRISVSMSIVSIGGGLDTVNASDHNGLAARSLLVSLQQFSVRTRAVLSFAVFFASLSPFLYVVDLFMYKPWTVSIVGAVFWIPLSLSLVHNLIRVYEEGKKTIPH